MRVFSVNMGADTGGVHMGLKAAFDAIHPAGWHYRSMVSSTTYIRYPQDLPWNVDRLVAEWQRADVVHLQNNWLTVQYLEQGWKRVQPLPRRPYVMTWHGTGYREDPEPYLEGLTAYCALGLVSTLDLWLLAPDRTEWAPNPVDIKRMRDLRRHVQPSGRIVIAHAPTDRAIKSTDIVLDAVDRLSRETRGKVQLMLIEKERWDRCLWRKAQADIYVDQLTLGYGQNALECWAMGMPVVAGAAPSTVDEIVRRAGSLPYEPATPDTLYDVLRMLVESADARAAASGRGTAYVERFHSFEATVAQRTGLYQAAATLSGGAQIVGPAADSPPHTPSPHMDATHA